MTRMRSKSAATIVAMLWAGSWMCACGGELRAPDASVDAASPAVDSGSGNDADAVSDTASASDGAAAAGCRRVGETCGAGDYCSAWICRCQNSTLDYMTVGDCASGTCSAVASACGRICNNVGGLREAVDQGCM